MRVSLIRRTEQTVGQEKDTHLLSPLSPAIKDSTTVFILLPLPTNPLYHLQISLLSRSSHTPMRCCLSD